MRKLLVTGGAGFIGVNFVYYWLDKYPDDLVVILDKLTYAGCKNSLSTALMSPKVRFYQGDIGDYSLSVELLAKYEIDTVVNFAAESHVDRSIVAPDSFIETNVVGTHALLKACKEYWLPEGLAQKTHRFHHISTDEVYGSLKPGDPPFTENTPYRPNSPYSASKASSDHLVRAFHKTYGLNVTTSNCSNNYGPYQFPEKLIPFCITNLLNGIEIPVYGDGLNIRDWLFVGDHCRGIDLILDYGSKGETYNVGGNNELKNIELVKIVAGIVSEQLSLNRSLRVCFPEFAGLDHEYINYVEDRPGHDRRYAVDSTKISKELGFMPTVSVQDGLESTVKWYLQNSSWWKELQN